LKDKVIRWLNGFKSGVDEGGNQSERTIRMDDVVKRVLEAVTTFFDDDSAEKANAAYSQLLSIPHFKGFLPYLGYLDDEGLFLLDGNGFNEAGEGVIFPGFVLEVSPQTGADGNMERILQSMFLQAPVGTSISITMHGSPHIKKRMVSRAQNVLSDELIGIEKEPWETRNKNVYREAIRNRIDFYEKGAYTSQVPGVKGYLFRDFRIIISVVFPKSIAESGSLDDAMSFRETMQSTLTSAMLPSWDWGQKELLNWVSDILNHQRVLDPGHRTEDLSVDESLPFLRDCFNKNGGLASVQSGDIYFSGTESSIATLSVSSFPKSPWFLSLMGNMIGDYFQQTLLYPCPFYITLNAITDDRNAFKSKASLMSARKTQQLDSQAGKFMPGLGDEAREWNYAVKALDDGSTMVNMGMKIMLISPKNDLKKNITDVIAIWANKGFTVYNDTFLTPLGFKSSIPMGCTKLVVKDLMSMGHLSPKFSSNAISLSPLLGEWKGTKNNTITLFGRRGQIMGFDLFDNEQGNYNFAVIAGSGSGKSFLLNEIAFSYLAKGSKVWIIDVGRSYEKLCDVLGGDFIEFSESSNICINPFTFIADIDEEMELLKPLLSQMMTGDSSTLTGVQMAELELAIKGAWEKHGTKTTVTIIRDELVSMCNEGDMSCPVGAMAKMLYPWTKAGVYGKYFEGDANLNFKNPFTVLELEELNSKKNLQTIVLMILMHRITNDMYVNRDGVKKIVIIDEAWSLMSGGDTAEFIEKGYRRARKYGGAFGTATQGVDDYYKTPGALAAFNNSDWVFMLRQKKESIERLEKEGKISMDPWKKRVLLGLSTRHGVYSEVFVNYPSGEGLGRLFVDPFTSLLYSSKDEDYQEIKRARISGMDTSAAINHVLANRGLRN
jgi:conjugal transfer ATP-binding protein TraC